MNFFSEIIESPSDTVIAPEERSIFEVLAFLKPHGSTIPAALQNAIDSRHISFEQAERMSQRFVSDLGMAPISIVDPDTEYPFHDAVALAYFHGHLIASRDAFLRFLGDHGQLAVNDRVTYRSLCDQLSDTLCEATRAAVGARRERSDARATALTIQIAITIVDVVTRWSKSHPLAFTRFLTELRPEDMHELQTAATPTQSE